MVQWPGDKHSLITEIRLSGSGLEAQGVGARDKISRGENITLQIDRKKHNCNASFPQSVTGMKNGLER